MSASSHSNSKDGRPCLCAANGVGCMSLSTTGKLLVAGGDGTITLFSNDHMWREIRPFVTVAGSITSISSNFDGSALLVATVQGSLFR